MHQDLELLLKLQVIDYDIGELERSKAYLPDMMENLNREIDEVKKQLQETAAALEQAKVHQKNLELDIKEKEAKLAKLQEQMMSIKTNKEYDALVSEIDGIKETISSNETELLETIDRISELENKQKELEERRGKVDENNSKQLQILQEKVDSIGSKMEVKEKEREDTLSSVPRRVLSVYERVRKGRSGAAVVAVKKRACGSCYKQLTPKKLQEIKRGDRIHTCDTCGRLLYWDDDQSA